MIMYMYFNSSLVDAFCLLCVSSDISQKGQERKKAQVDLLKQRKKKIEEGKKSKKN